MASLGLLDTPRRTSLQTRSASLRASIKTWERSFAAAHDGKKPSKSDIKSDGGIAAKYKEFQKIGDVLAGRLDPDALQSPQKKQRRDSVKRRLYDLTPRKPQPAIVEPHPSEIDPYDVPPSATPKRFLSAIGPTPQRDGKVLGLFDLLSRSGGTRESKNTPGSGNKKRKVDALEETDGNVVVQTPSRKRTATEEDILRHLAPAVEGSVSAVGKIGRTPASESKKYRLSHFFATPSTVRYANLMGDVDTAQPEKTPLRDLVLGIGSAGKEKDLSGNPLDTTPVFLRRSQSFKERLASAKPGTEPVSPSAIQKGPPTLRRYRSAPKPISQIVRDFENLENQEPKPVGTIDDTHDDDDDDAMEAMRDMENDPQVQETQPQELSDFEGQGESDLDDAKPAPQKEKVWKKKGQKRTTKRSNMKPAMVRKAKEPRFVVADDSEDEISHIEETQFPNNVDHAAVSPYEEFSDDELQAIEETVLDEREQRLKTDAQLDEDYAATKHISIPAQKRLKGKTASQTERPHAFKPKKSSRAATINPNAISHQNFKSLKIRGKSAKSTGAGRGKFGRRR